MSWGGDKLLRKKFCYAPRWLVSLEDTGIFRAMIFLPAVMLLILDGLVVFEQLIVGDLIMKILVLIGGLIFAVGLVLGLTAIYNWLSKSIDFSSRVVNYDVVSVIHQTDGSYQLTLKKHDSNEKITKLFDKSDVDLCYTDDPSQRSFAKQIVNDRYKDYSGGWEIVLYMPMSKKELKVQ